MILSSYPHACVHTQDDKINIKKIKPKQNGHLVLHLQTMALGHVRGVYQQGVYVVLGMESSACACSVSTLPAELHPLLQSQHFLLI